MNKANKHKAWEIEVARAKERPAMYLGEQKAAHLAAVSSCLQLVRKAKAFRQFMSATVDLSPTQYVVSCKGGPLLAPIESLFSWKDKYVLMEGWRSINERLREERRIITLDTGSDSDLPEWKRYFGSPSGPTLESPTHPAMLANYFVVAYQVSDGYWCQSFRHGYPEAEPHHIQVSSTVSLLVAAELNPTWFTGLPYTVSEVQKLSLLPGVKAEWHSQDELLADNVSLGEEVLPWLQA